MAEQCTPLATREQLCALATELSSKRDRTLRLRRECEQALKDEGSVNARFTRDLTSRAKTECLKITEMMCHKLPIELRNLVYEFICIEDQPIPVGPYFHFRPYNRKMDSDRLASALSNGRLRIDHTERADPAILMPYSYVFNPAYVGPIVKVEMQKVYLANNTFSICNVDQGIDTFLRWGSSRRIPDPVMPLGTPFGPGSGFSVVIENALCLIKAGEFVRRLQIRVKCEHYDNHEPWDMAHYRRDLFATECGILRNARITLEPLLFLLQQDQPLELEFIIMTALRPDAMAVECQQRYFINLLQALRNTFYILIYDRGNTKIRIVHHDDKISAFPRDITALWSLTKEQWEQEKVANQGKSTWSADFYIAPQGFDAIVPEGHGGFPAPEQSALLRERWGIENVLRDKTPKWPITEGKYWPIGNGPPGWW